MKVEVLKVEAKVRVRRDRFHRETLDRTSEVLPKAHSTSYLPGATQKEEDVEQLHRGLESARC